MRAATRPAGGTPLHAVEHVTPPRAALVASGRRAACALLAWRDAHPVLALYVVAGLSRLLVLGAAAAGGLLLPRHERALPWTDEGPLWLRYLARWDSIFYLHIAEQGRLMEPARWAFDPGYPLAIRFVHDALPPLGLLGAGVLVNAVAFALAVPALYHLTARWFDRATAWRAAALFTLLPASFYFTAVYSDGLFTALLVGFLLALAHRRWFPAAALASLAGVVRPQGILLPGILLLGALLERPRAGRIPAAALVAVPLAAALPLLDMAHAYAVTGDFFFQEHARTTTWPQNDWRNPWRVLWWDLAPVHLALARASFALILAAMLWGLRDALRRRAEAPLEAHAWSFVAGLVCFVYSDPAAAVRYVLPILGVTWMLGAWARTPARAALATVLSVGALVTVAALFAAWHPYY